MKKKAINKYIFEWKNADSWTPEKVLKKKQELSKQNKYIQSAIDYHKAGVITHTLGVSVQQSHLDRNLNAIKSLDEMKFEPKKVISTWTDKPKKSV